MKVSLQNLRIVSDQSDYSDISGRFYVLSKQIIYIGCAYATVYLIYAKFRATYDGNHDTFRVEFLVVPVGGLAFLVNHDFSPLEVGCEMQDANNPLHYTEIGLFVYSKCIKTFFVYVRNRSCGRFPSTLSRWPSCLSSL